MWILGGDVPDLGKPETSPVMPLLEKVQSVSLQTRKPSHGASARQKPSA